jgi:hypothetical protein
VKLRKSYKLEVQNKLLPQLEKRNQLAQLENLKQLALLASPNQLMMQK